MRIPYALAVYDEKEIEAINKVLRSHKTLVNGDNTKKFEGYIAKLFGKKHGIMVNSGSSGNLLAFELLNLPKGSEVVTPIVTFATTVAPLIQKGLKPNFVDVEVGTYLTDINQLKGAINKKTKALMIPSLLGNVPDLPQLMKIAQENNLYLVEDSCDTLGPTIDGVPTGKFSHITTTSFYGSHVITTLGGGGMICVNDDNWSRRLKIFRGWGRISAVDETEDIEKRYSIKIGGVTYDSKFIYDEIGYNFYPLEASATFGLAQLEKFESFIRLRTSNFERLYRFFQKYEKFFILPKQSSRVKTSWLAFPLTIKEGSPFDRLQVVKYLEQNDIQTRPLFSGNLLKHPAFKNINCRLAVKDYPVADMIMKSSFLIGCHQGLTAEHLDYIEKTFSTFLDRL